MRVFQLRFLKLSSDARASGGRVAVVVAGGGARGGALRAAARDQPVQLPPAGGRAAAARAGVRAHAELRARGGRAGRGLRARHARHAGAQALGGARRLPAPHLRAGPACHQPAAQQ